MLVLKSTKIGIMTKQFTSQVLNHHPIIQMLQLFAIPGTMVLESGLQSLEMTSFLTFSQTWISMEIMFMLS